MSFVLEFGRKISWGLKCFKWSLYHKVIIALVVCCCCCVVQECSYYWLHHCVFHCGHYFSSCQGPVWSAAVNIVNFMLILRPIFPSPPLYRRHHHYHLRYTINLFVRCCMFLDYRGSYCWGFFRHTALNLILYCLLSQVLEHNLNASYVCGGLTLDCWVIHDWLQRDGMTRKI